MLTNLREEKRKWEVDVEKQSQTIKVAVAQSKQLAAQIKQWTDLRDSVNAFLDKIAGQDPKNNPLGDLLRSERIEALMATTDAAVLQVKVQVAGAELQTDERFGKVKETGKGGGVVSYVLYDAKTSAIKASGNLRAAP